MAHRGRPSHLITEPPAFPFVPVLLSLAMVSWPAFGQEDLFFGDLPIVASISRLPQRISDAPTAVTVIDRRTIRASGARALSDIFRLIPGFQTFAQSDIPARVNYHGVTDDADFSPRVQVLVDGRSLHSPLFRNGMNWALVPVALEDIERIEVVRGSNTTSYGTNAFLGVINIITVDPALVAGASVSGNHGNQGVRDYTVRVGGQLGEGGNIRLTYQQLRDDGLDEGSDPRGAPDWRDRNRSRLLDLKASYQIGLRDLLEMHLGRIEGLRYDGRLVPGTRSPRASDPLRDLDESSTWLQLRWLRTLSESADFSVRYTYSEDKADSTFIHPTRLPGYNRINEVGDRGTRHEVEMVNTLLPFAHTRLVWGASWRVDTLHSDTMLHGKGKIGRDIGRIFANTEWKPLSWFTGNLGVSYEYDSLAGNHVAPRASASFHLTPNDTVRVGFSRAWRTAGTLDYRANQLNSPTEAEWVGNPDLPAERLDSWELGYLGDWREWRMSLDVRMFRERLSDRLMNRIRTASGMPNSVQAVQNIRIRGFEYHWKWQPLDATRIAVGYAHIGIDSDNTAIGERLSVTPGSNYRSAFKRYLALAEDSAPERSTSVMLMQKLPYGIDLSVAHYRVGSMKWSRNTEIEGYRRTDLRLAYPFVLGPQRGEVAYTVQSLNGAHSDQRVQRVVDRRHWVSLRLDF